VTFTIKINAYGRRISTDITPHRRVTVTASRCSFCNYRCASNRWV